MHRKILLLGLLLVAAIAMTGCPASYVETRGEPSPAQAGYDNQQAQPAWTAENHASLMVDGQTVFYYYDADGAAVYYRLAPNGERLYYAENWQPWYMQNGARVPFAPAPYFFVGNSAVYHYWNGNAYRYYTYNGGRRRFYAASWRPYRNVSGRRIWYRPRVRYQRSVWRRHRQFARYRRTRVRYRRSRRNVRRRNLRKYRRTRRRGRRGKRKYRRGKKARRKRR